MKYAKMIISLMLILCLVIGMAACGSKTNEKPQEEAGSEAAGSEAGDEDQAAADNVAALIDAIYVQQRTEETDAQCAAAKEAWDALTDEQKELVEGENADEEKLMEVVLDAGAEDLEVEDGTAEIWAAPEAFDAISKALEAAGIETTEAGITRKADNTVEIKDASVATQVLRLIDKLEDLDDVQAVHSNADIPDEIMEQVEED